MTVTIFHNPRCSKSRETLQLLLEQGIEPEIVEYLKTPPTVVQLQEILDSVAIFAKACFGHPSPSKRQKLNVTTYLCPCSSCVHHGFVMTLRYTTTP